MIVGVKIQSPKDGPSLYLYSPPLHGACGVQGTKGRSDKAVPVLSGTEIDGDRKPGESERVCDVCREVSWRWEGTGEKRGAGERQCLHSAALPTVLEGPWGPAHPMWGR